MINVDDMDTELTGDRIYVGTLKHNSDPLPPIEEIEYMSQM